MDFAFTEDQLNIREAVLRHCSQFSDDYWLEHDRSGEFPVEFHKSMAEAGWLGVAMPEALRQEPQAKRHDAHRRPTPKGLPVNLAAPKS